MNQDQAYQIFSEIKDYYDLIQSPKYRNVDLKVFKEKYDTLSGIQEYIGSDQSYIRLINAMSQIIARLVKQEKLSDIPKDKIWSNLSERGMNKVIPAVYNKKGTTFPIEWTDKWGYICYVSNGFWTANNYRVMDALGYMFLLKEGGDTLPDGYNPIFNDLFDVISRENQLRNPDKAGANSEIQLHRVSGSKYSISFTDKDFRKNTGTRLNSSEILDLLLQTSRVEFKLSFPLRLKSTGNKEIIHQMNFFSRFFELSYEDIKIRKDGIVQNRRYRVYFNTLLGELFVNNLKARFNDRVDLRFYTLPDSAQIFYRRQLMHNNFKTMEIYLHKIAEAAGLRDTNKVNLKQTVENNILGPLKEHGYIQSYENTEGLDGTTKYIIMRNSEEDLGGKDAGSVKKGCRVGKK
jgi:hypothetical protein